ncbi:MAG: DNA mismatch repair endonuclease MutL [Rhabdochlamydiaceae bacterium]|nr:DNA mismatch repair endonuclease MutL [Candidatus Amphrikana amoebophyrae]
MSGIIKKLSSSLIDKIAAGEVIENPASVVKELVENSIDAQSSLITIEIIGGGFQKIRVADDGVGMSRQDALISIERHATSKLRSLDDLFNISSMGFRGEALSSIAAVSKFSLTTKDGSDFPATHITFNGQIKVSDGAREKGTTIEVDALFYNVPARKKFQKSVNSATAEVTKVITKLSLANPFLSFRFFSNGQEILNSVATHKGDFYQALQSRLIDTLPKVYSESGYKLDYTDHLVELKGVIGVPTDTRSNRLGQYLFINNRSVFSPLISAVMQEVYSTRIFSKDHPIFVLFLKVDPQVVDVNVHPQKREVRLSNEKEIIQSLKKAVLLALSCQKQDKESVASSFDFANLEEFAPSQSFDQVAKRVQPDQEETLFEYKPSLSLDPLCRYKQYDLIDSETFNEIFSQFKFEPGLLFFDRVSISKRIAFDAFYKSLKGEKIFLSKQALLFPISIELSREEAQIIESQIELLESLGLSVRLFGLTCIVVESISPYYEENDIERMIIDLIPYLQVSSIEEIKLKEIAKLAVKNVERVDGELHTLLEQLFKTSSPLLSPSGKPTISLFTPEDIGKQHATIQTQKSSTNAKK